MTDLAALTRALGAHYGRTRVADPPQPLKRRNGTELPAPRAGDRGTLLAGVPVIGQAGESSRQRIRRPGSDRDNTFRPKAEHFANNPVPATARVSAPGTSRTQVPGKFTRRTDGVRPSTVRGTDANGRPVSVEAHFDSEGAFYRAWVTQRHNLAVSAGDALPAGNAYPDETTRHGNPGPGALYGANGNGPRHNCR